ncbi:hypothetical protein KM043_000114 [Ampulex compressa]|nr:hypothetical protein KM043_000114 [Ampulex compressa]
MDCGDWGWTILQKIQEIRIQGEENISASRGGLQQGGFEKEHQAQAQGNIERNGWGCVGSGPGVPVMGSAWEVLRDVCTVRGGLVTARLALSYDVVECAYQRNGGGGVRESPAAL